MKFGWDEQKNRINIEKHGISFEDAKAIFEHHQKQCEKGVKDIFQDEHVEDMKHILKEWNMAADYVVNDHIISSTNIKA